MTATAPETPAAPSEAAHDASLHATIDRMEQQLVPDQRHPQRGHRHPRAARQRLPGRRAGRAGRAEAVPVTGRALRAAAFVLALAALAYTAALVMGAPA